MRKVPLPVQPELLLVVDRVQPPQTTPFVMTRTVPGVPLAVPLTPPLVPVVSVSVFPAGVADVTVYVIEPVTWLAELVFNEAVPAGGGTWLAELVFNEAVPAGGGTETKHGPKLKKPKPVMLSGSLAPLTLVSLNWVKKFSWLAGPMPPTSWASQFPLVVVSTVVVGVRVPQLKIAAARANRVRIATFFMDVLRIVTITKNREMRAGPSMDVRVS
ncbi:hypothetical protein SBA1_1510007 [Candidatus Sulfotelmatobacter kueseliae]|uniref:Uncharacterized protein n=1 Tax=Candidatus Sulfotelmatobacter kueseliae TaxID=2042962 RepID=A0A2U3KA59_9BACT|nr:hypothetical protein SBA1_1510007 [Candidatus Sulfotelmatobacter kueseliae]